MKVQAPQALRWTKSQYHAMHDQGWFIDKKVELLDGEIIHMPAPSNEHDVSTELVSIQLRQAFGVGHWVRIQMALDINISSEPVPDVAVVLGTPRMTTATPITALLIVEIANSSLAYDRRRKASLYASVNVADYWIVNLPDRTLEVRRNPVADSSEPFGARYADVTTLAMGQSVSPLSLPHATIAVADCLP